MPDEKWLATQNRVLEQFSTGESLSTVLHNLAQGAERLMDGGRCAILLADEDGKHLRVAAAPSMPDAFREAAYMTIGEGHGACGTAAALRQPVICDNVPTDPKWERYRAFAETFSIGACWSTPVFGGDGRVLGTFAVLYDRPHKLAASEQPIIDTCTHLAGLVIDRRRQECALRESEQRFRAMADAAPVLIWMSGLDKTYHYFNQPWLAFTGRTMEQQLEAGWADGVHPEDQDRRRETYLNAFERREPFSMEYRFRRHDGVYRWILDHGVPRHASNGAFLGYIGSCVDITDRRNTEQDLRESEGRLRFTLDAARIGTWQWNIAAGTVRWSDNLARIHGQEAHELTGRFDDFVQHIDPAHRDRVLDEIRQAIEQGTPYETEYPTVLGEGKPGWMAARGKVIYGPDGQAVRMTGVCMDVTDRRRAEDLLQVHARQQQTVAQLGQLALVGEDLQALMEETVRRVAEAFDVPLAKMLECEPHGRSLRLRAGVGWQDGLVGQAIVRATPDSQAGYTLLTDQPVIVKHLPSETRFVGMPLLHDHGVVSGMSVIIPGIGGRPWGVFGVHTPEQRDFTHDDINFLQSVAHLLAAAIQRKTGERDLQALNETLEQRVTDRTAVAEHRAAQLRALAAELAQAERRERRRLSKLLHDHLQQLLVAAKLRVDALTGRRDHGELGDMADQIDELLDQAIEASRSLTVELSPPILYDAGLPAAIEWLCRWMQDKHGLTVELNMDVVASQTPLASEVCVFLFDAVRELLFNVVKHAGVQQAEVRVTHKARGLLRITVLDRGAGFDAATSKEADVTAAGFGLFSIQQRVQLFGGQLDVHSQPNTGTEISVEIDLAADETSPRTTGDQPVLDAATDRGVSEVSPPSPVAGEAVRLPSLGETQPVGASADDGPDPGAAAPIRVLVADDHAPLRKGLVTLLTAQHDIKVIGEAVDGEMAIEAAQRLRPDVLLMDIHMPGLNGIEATRQLAKQMPELHIIGLSIEEHEEMGRVMRDAGAATYLPKGSPPAVLFAAIRSAMPVAEEA